MSSTRVGGNRNALQSNLQVYRFSTRDISEPPRSTYNRAEGDLSSHDPRLLRSVLRQVPRVSCTTIAIGFDWQNENPARGCPARLDRHLVNATCTPSLPEISKSGGPHHTTTALAISVASGRPSQRTFDSRLSHRPFHHEAYLFKKSQSSIGAHMLCIISEHLI